LRPWEKVKIKGGMHNYIILSNYWYYYKTLINLSVIIEWQMDNLETWCLTRKNKILLNITNWDIKTHVEGIQHKFKMVPEKNYPILIEYSFFDDTQPIFIEWQHLHMNSLVI
jgi:hypothetical protein